MDRTPASVPLDLEDLRHITLWAAGCARRALPVFEARIPGDPRPRDAIAAACAFAQGRPRTAHLRKAAWAAIAAARDASDPAAAAAARAAATAAGAAYTHPIATPHQVKHIVGPAAYGAQAIAFGAADQVAVLDAEIRWAMAQASPRIRQVLQRFPEYPPGRGPFQSLLHRLDTGLRG